LKSLKIQKMKLEAGILMISMKNLLRVKSKTSSVMNVRAHGGLVNSMEGAATVPMKIGRVALKS
jgi:hypothetical protein